MKADTLKRPDIQCDNFKDWVLGTIILSSTYKQGLLFWSKHRYTSRKNKFCIGYSGNGRRKTKIPSNRHCQLGV